MPVSPQVLGKGLPLRRVLLPFGRRHMLDQFLGSRTGLTLPCWHPHASSFLIDAFCRRSHVRAAGGMRTGVLWASVVGTLRDEASGPG